MSAQNKAEAAVSYAALILADAQVGITAEKLQTLLKAANVDDVEPIWTTLFAKALDGKDVKNLLINISATGPAHSQEVAGGHQALGPGDTASTDNTQGDEKDTKPKDDESDEEMGFGDLFG
ncbi:60S acidic ribosomal protein P1 [Viridothelium virens]|uniref:Large ribosomal subunit protein P1 n=1 Tax=Viridothelium virens TaxID=1048519 RepID=A0A6A6HEE1_VIRVR|nr:60S acidic ribosomal protein P1 [Viridothelium virens]